MQSIKKKWNIPVNSNTKYSTEMKLVPIYMDYFLLQLDSLQVYLGEYLYGKFLPNYKFFNVNSQIRRKNGKIHR